MQKRTQFGKDFNMAETPETLQIGDLVIFKDQSKNHIELTLWGGKVALMMGAQVLLLHSDNIYRSHPVESLRKLKVEDLTPGVQII